jgi:hypothetical protein
MSYSPKGITAVTIQKTIRCYLTRKKINNQKLAAVTIQKTVRRFIKQELNNPDKISAANTIQKAARDYLIREKTNSKVLKSEIINNFLHELLFGNQENALRSLKEHPNLKLSSNQIWPILNCVIVKNNNPDLFFDILNNHTVPFQTTDREITDFLRAAPKYTELNKFKELDLILSKFDVTKSPILSLFSVNSVDKAQKELDAFPNILSLSVELLTALVQHAMSKNNKNIVKAFINKINSELKTNQIDPVNLGSGFDTTDPIDKLSFVVLMHVLNGPITEEHKDVIKTQINASPHKNAINYRLLTAFLDYHNPNETLNNKSLLIEKLRVSGITGENLSIENKNKLFKAAVNIVLHSRHNPHETMYNRSVLIDNLRISGVTGAELSIEDKNALFKAAANMTIYDHNQKESNNYRASLISSLNLSSVTGVGLSLEDKNILFKTAFNLECDTLIKELIKSNVTGEGLSHEDKKALLLFAINYSHSNYIKIIKESGVSGIGLSVEDKNELFKNAVTNYIHSDFGSLKIRQIDIIKNLRDSGITGAGLSIEEKQELLLAARTANNSDLITELQASGVTDDGV